MTHTIPLIFGLGTTEIILIVLVILLLFGGRKIPELMRGIGKGIKSFKDGVAGAEEEIMDDDILKGTKKETKRNPSATSPDEKSPPESPAG